MFCAHVFVGVHAFVHMCMWRLVDFGYLLSMSTSFFFETRLLTEPRAHPLTRVTGHQFPEIYFPPQPHPHSRGYRCEPNLAFPWLPGV